jgi:hypothetical protein
MTIRYSFVEHFGEECASRVEEAALMHLREDLTGVHSKDKWGSDAFRHLFLVCIGRDCFTRWREWHKIDASYEDILAWALKFANLSEHDGDLPDYMAALAGAYGPWINWEASGETEPESNEYWRERNLRWAHADEEEMARIHDENLNTIREAAERINDESLNTMESAAAEGMRILNKHLDGGPS